MKKLSFLFALLYASVMGWAMQYCELPTGHLSDANFGDASGRVLLTLQKDGNNVIVKLKNNNANGNPQTGLNYMWVNATDATNNNATYGSHSAANAEEISVTVEFGSAKDSYTFNNIHWAYEGFGGEWAIDGLTVAASDLCTAGSKLSPELSLNATSKTLEIDATAETFQIVPIKAAGSGNVSYETSDVNIATVSSTGLITAVGAGTATITVSVAENDDYAADSKTLTVIVIDWPNIGWLDNSGDSYKLHISPEIGDGFGGKRIEGSNIWVGCPSAEFGACSIDFTHVGAGASFPLSNFTKARNQFTLVCQGITYTFTVYRKFDGVNLAKNMPAYAGAIALPKAEANDGNKGSRWASGGTANHYAAVGDMAQDWWYVDLGAMYEISSIKTLFEGAAPKNYDFLTSPNGDSWVVIDSYNATPNIGNEDENYNEYSYSPGKVGRYVKIFAREAVQGNFAYGISIWEFEVYGQPAEGYDTNNPVLASASLNGDPTSSQVQIAVSATDAEGAITTYRVKDTSHGIDRNCAVAAGVITISGLAEGTNYSFTVTALDAIGNQSNAIVVAASTVADMTIPQTAAPTPDGTGKDVLAIYSDVFPNILAHPFDKDGFAGMTVYAEKNIGGNSCLIYDRSGSAPTFTTWGMYDDGTNAIIAATGYSDPDNAAHKGVYAAGMDNLHIDIWSLQACATILVRINDGGRTGDLRLSHNGSGWQSYDIPLSEFVAGANIDNVRWFKFEAFDAVTGKIAIDNVYFWKPESGSKTVSVSVNDGSMGSATAKVGDDEVTLVTVGTEVTFTATPNSGYDFINWTQGGGEVSTSATYVTTITANTALVANFEAHRTAYCSEEVTNAQGHTIYLTVKKTNNANEYMILFEGSSNTQITGSHGNIQFRLTHVNGSDGEYHFDGTKWIVDATGFGSIYTTFTAADFRAITITNRYIPLTTSNSAADEFNFPTNDASIIQWDATCTDDEAPMLAAPIATPLSGTSVRLAVSATDNMAALLTYNVNYKPEGDTDAGTDVEFNGTAGETTYKNIKGLSAGVRYQFSVTVSDGTNTSVAQLCYAKPTMPTAPVPTHNAGLVRAIYSDTYESALAHDFIKNNWSGAIYSEQNIGGDHLLVYTSDPAVQVQMPDVAWGENNDGDNAIIAKDGYNDGTNKGLDARSMGYLHFDMWSAIATIYPEVYLNDTKLAGFQLEGSGWQSFDIPLSSLTDEQKNNVRWMKFIAFRTPNPEEIAIDNVYFYAEVPAKDVVRDGLSAGKWGTICPKQTVENVEGATFYQISYLEEQGGLPFNMVFDQIPGTTLTAGQPYFFIADGTQILGNKTGAELTVADDGVNGFYGYISSTDAPMELANWHTDYDANEENTFIIYNNSVFRINQGGTMLNSERCYININSTEPSRGVVAPAPGLKRLNMSISGTNVTTGLNALNVSDKLTKVIIDGQLYILREGKLYDLTGRMVK